MHSYMTNSFVLIIVQENKHSLTFLIGNNHIIISNELCMSYDQFNAADVGNDSKKGWLVNEDMYIHSS